MAKKVKVKKVEKITEKYLRERVNFEKKCVLKNLTFKELWSLVDVMDTEDQLKVFSKAETTIHPLEEDSIDSLFLYLPPEVREGIDFMELSREEKLELLRNNKNDLLPILEKKGFTERLDLDEKKVITTEFYRSSNLWDIIKSGKYNFIEGKKNYD